jgi:signal transduction histidine kinase
MTRTGSIPLRFERADIAALARTTIEPLSREAEAMDAAIEVEAPDDAPKVLADPEKIAWVIATLVGNSLRYARRGTRLHPGGRIVVRVTPDERENFLTLAVQDDGPGIPRDKLATLFKRRAGAQHAIGLGLTLVSDIVGAHGGELKVESSEDTFEHGTTVRVMLPMGERAETRP